TNWLNVLVRPALAFSPDGKKLVCSRGGATLRQFEAETGTEIPGPDVGPRAPVSTLALSADGKTLRTYGPGDAVRCWDWSTGKETGQRQVPANATHAAFAADGRYAFVAGHAITLFAADGKSARTLAAGNSSLDAFALSPDGALVATRDFLKPEIHLWDTTTLQERFTLGRADDGPAGSCTVPERAGVLPPALVFPPAGRRLAAGGPRRQLCLWDVATGTLLWELPLQAGQAIERFAFSPSGRVLATLQADRTVI